MLTKFQHSVFAVALTTFVAPVRLLATPSMPLPFSKLYFESTHMLSGQAMCVKVTGTQTKAGLQSLSIEAFDKIYKIKNSDISKLKDHEFNGGWIFFEISESGPVLYIWFVQGSAFGTSSRQLFKLYKSGKVEISEYITGPFAIEHQKAPNLSINNAAFGGSDPTACGCRSGYVGR